MFIVLVTGGGIWKISDVLDGASSTFEDSKEQVEAEAKRVKKSIQDTEARLTAQAGVLLGTVPRLLDDLIVDLGDDDAMVRQNAMFFLRRMGGNAFSRLSEIVKEQRDPFSKRQIAALRTLGRMGSRAAEIVPWLRTNVTDNGTPRDLGEESLRALAKLGEARDSTLFVGVMYRAREISTAYTAAESAVVLCRRHSEAAHSFLFDLLSDECRGAGARGARGQQGQEHQERQESVDDLEGWTPLRLVIGQLHSRGANPRFLHGWARTRLMLDDLDEDKFVAFRDLLVVAETCPYQ